MGWLTMPLSSMQPHSTPKAYLDAQFTYDQRDPAGKGRALRIVASSCLRNKVYYAAAVPSTDGVDQPTFAIVCLVKWNPRDREGYVFGYKDMTEHMGPCEAECPERILALLGDTDEPSALNWRRRCIDNLARAARPLEHGMRIRLPSPVRFTDGYEGAEFTVHKRGRRVALSRPGVSYPEYRLSGLRHLSWTVVPETKVHKTVFA
ncbi:hypothetical protein [uncultured Sphingomonas sp.]|uniref:DUF6927 domain-containing protein n=1 Tax=uncultured Sphingomonas sp. TaxID=158754 RepID=UPI0025F5F2AC|nr:hypothetical protein [uncultured Sphingomonas sp.]